MFGRYSSEIWRKHLQPFTGAPRKFNANSAILPGLSEWCAKLQIRDSCHIIGTGQVCAIDSNVIVR